MKKKILTSVLSVAMIASVCGPLAACGNGGGPTHFTWWLTVGDPSYYREYENNPVIQYITENVQFKGEDGEMKSISFDFTAPTDTTSGINEINNMAANGDFMDVTDPSQYEGSISDMYEYGAIIDLTPYVTDPEVMPNLAAWIADPANSDLVPYLYKETKDGRKILAIPGIYDQLDNESQAFGFQYRRDWLVKYGTQPQTFYDPMGLNEEADYTTPTANPNYTAGGDNRFSGSFTLNADGTQRSDTPSQNTELPEGADGDSWVDNVVFPSGSSDPLYISDWQWMFEIYETAMQEEGVTSDGYMLSIYYPGYNANGDLTTGFGGGGVNFYRKEDNTTGYGFVEDGFRAYLECMNNWYELGWLDQKFNTRSSDNFYAIDNANIAAGNVGLWMGNATRLGTRMSLGNGDASDGAIVYFCASPVNDIPDYDGDPSTTDYTSKATEAEAETAMSGGTGSEYMLQIPRVMFQNERLGGGAVISKNAAETKDLQLLLSFFDYLFGEEGALLKTMGLNAEQAEGNSLYEEEGLSGGAYTDNGDGTYSYAYSLERNASGIRNAMTLARIPGLNLSSKIKYNFPETYLNNRAQWTRYEASGFIGGLISSQLTTEESEIGGNISQWIQTEYLYKIIYQFIMGNRGLDNASWNSYRTEILSLRNYNTTVADVIEVYNGVFERLFGADGASLLLS